MVEKMYFWKIVIAWSFYIIRKEFWQDSMNLTYHAFQTRIDKKRLCPNHQVRFFPQHISYLILFVKAQHIPVQGIIYRVLQYCQRCKISFTPVQMYDRFYYYDCFYLMYNPVPCTRFYRSTEGLRVISGLAF